MMFDILGLTCNRGQKSNGRHPIGELRDGTVVTLPIRIIHGASDGPVVSLTGTMHGDEWFGVAMINRLFDAIDPSELSGTLVGFPVTNPFAVITKSRLTSLDYEGFDMDHIFPGNATGLIAERVAATVFDNAIQRADYHIDYHEGGYDFIARYLLLRQPTESESVSAENLRLARAFGMGIPINVMQLTPDRGMGRGSLAYQAGIHGVPCLMVELGGGGRIWPEFVEIGYKGTTNVLKELGMLPGEQVLVDEVQHVGTSSQWPRPTKGGWWEQVVDLGQVVEADVPVGYVRDAFGEIVEELRSPFKSVIFDIRNTAVIMSGEWTVHCGKLE